MATIDPPCFCHCSDTPMTCSRCAGLPPVLVNFLGQVCEATLAAMEKPTPTPRNHAEWSANRTPEEEAVIAADRAWGEAYRTALEALRASRKPYRVFEGAPGMFCILNDDGSYLTRNQLQALLDAVRS